MNRTPDELITAMEFCALDGGASAFLIGDNEMARLVAGWRDMKQIVRGSDDAQLDAIKNEHIINLRQRNLLMIETGDYGYRVHQWSPDGVAPLSDYDTPHEAAARVLQLLKITEPVTPQSWPEECCIGFVEKRDTP